MQIESRFRSYVLALPVGRRTALGAAVCLLFGIAILLFGSRLVDTSEPHLYGALNDQIAYINVARSLQAKGTLESNTILPSTLWQKATNDLLYMPGHPAALAISYTLFGVGAFQSIIPSLVSYLISMLAIYLIGARFYSPMVGLVASLLFGLFPPVLFFAFTAMAELTFLAAFTTSVCACLYLPPRLRPWLSPLCLVVPFLFRETAAFVAIPLGLYFWLDRRDKLAWRSLVFVALSVVLLGALYRSGFSAGRPSIWKAGIFGDWHAVYDDAPGQQAVSNPSLQEWIRVLPARTVRNAKFLFFNPDFAPWAGGANYTLMAVMALVGLVAVWRRDKLAWSFSALNVIAISALVILFSTSGYRGARYLLFTYALNVVVIAWLLVKAGSRVDAKRLILVVAASATAAALSLFSLGVVRNVYAFLADQDLIDRGRTSILVTIGYALGAIVAVLLVVLRLRKLRHASDKQASETAIINPLLLVQSFPALSVVAVTALVMLFSVDGYRSMRYLLFAYAMSVVVITWLLARVTSRANRRRPTLAVAVCASALALLLFSFAVVRNMYTFFAERDVIDRRYAAALEEIGPDKSRMLVTPFEWSTRYRYYHFPVSWAFAPYNQPTLELLAARFDIGTLILDNKHPLLENPDALARLGFYKEEALTIDGVNYAVFKRRAL